ncbi:MAG: methyltransferase domain-containing protein [Spirirestis rafaelensis WJT71-NPBG6]|jgi:2-polyprenyl-3-methyl-5-hydroxy-6-metoxy-1,4-benzoquinol methylase/archaellum component FlaC|nr:methyltransferase domain-containing protein [Spirirestis rafaelensis WJT71-NPBG6]
MTGNDSFKKDYPSYQELTEDELDENHSLKKMFRLVGENKRVADFGCATGYFAQLLSNKKCKVTGIEINPDAAKAAEKYCEQVIVADLDFVSVTEVLAGEKFDVAVFGDILEHLRNPWRVLEETQHLLKPDGYIVASIPNIAHGAIRLSLLQGKFEYTELGILDATHLRFFTRKTLVDMFERSGYLIGNIDCTKVPVFSDIPLLPHIDKNDFSIELTQKIEQDEDADSFQFIIRAFPLSLEGKYAALNEQYSQLKNQIERSQSQLQQTQAEQEHSQSQLQQTQAELEQSQSQLQQTQAEQEHSQSQLQQTQAELEQSKLQLQHTHLELEQSKLQLQHTQAELEQSQSQLQHTQAELEQSQSQLQHTQAELEQSQSQLQHTQAELEELKATISWIETSKFWKLRAQWLKLKKLSRMVKGS